MKQSSMICQSITIMSVSCMRNIQAVLVINTKFRPMDFELRNNSPNHDSKSNKNQEYGSYEREFKRDYVTYEAFEMKN